VVNADLQRTYLHRANLQNTDLRAANFQRACLVDADLQGAHLQQGDLRRANLRGANLQGARADRHTVWPQGFERDHGVIIEGGGAVGLSTPRTPELRDTCSVRGATRDS
jgi:hypothetical protein